MVQKHVLATFPCRVRRRARLIQGALIGFPRAMHRAQRHHIVGPVTLGHRCSKGTGVQLGL